MTQIKLLKTQFNTETFIKRAKEIHGDKYIYDEVNYVNRSTKVKIICPIHGPFYVTPSHHIYSKSGCVKCAGRNKRTTEEFKELAQKVHGNKYDYSKVKYINNRTPVCIICPKHGEFWQRPYDHLRKIGCMKCYHERRTIDQTYTPDQFFQMAKNKFGDKYDYSKSVYIDYTTPILISCPIHGDFYQKPCYHIFSEGCQKCGREKANQSTASTTEIFIQKARKIHGDKYIYSLVNYTRSVHNVTIICPIHGEFEQTPSSHLLGAGCPKCRLKNQMLLFEKLTKIFDSDTFIWEYTSSWLGKQRIDICMIDYKIAIEYDGLQHYEPIEFFGGQKEFQHRIKLDAKKDELCKQNGFYMFRMKYNYTEEDFYNLCKQIEKIKNTDDPDKLIKKTV